MSNGGNNAVKFPLCVGNKGVLMWGHWLDTLWGSSLWPFTTEISKVELLTIVGIIEDNELLPGVLHHHLEDDVI